MAPKRGIRKSLPARVENEKSASSPARRSPRVPVPNKSVNNPPSSAFNDDDDDDKHNSNSFLPYNPKSRSFKKSTNAKPQNASAKEASNRRHTFQAQPSGLSNVYTAAKDTSQQISTPVSRKTRRTAALEAAKNQSSDQNILEDLDSPSYRMIHYSGEDFTKENEMNDASPIGLSATTRLSSRPRKPTARALEAMESKKKPRLKKEKPDPKPIDQPAEEEPETEAPNIERKALRERPARKVLKVVKRKPTRNYKPSPLKIKLNPSDAGQKLYEIVVVALNGDFVPPADPEQFIANARKYFEDPSQVQLLGQDVPISKSPSSDPAAAEVAVAPSENAGVTSQGDDQEHDESATELNGHPNSQTSEPNSKIDDGIQDETDNGMDNGITFDTNFDTNVGTVLESESEMNDETNLDFVEEVNDETNRDRNDETTGDAIILAKFSTDRDTNGETNVEPLAEIDDQTSIQAKETSNNDRIVDADLKPDDESSNEAVGANCQRDNKEIGVSIHGITNAGAEASDEPSADINNEINEEISDDSDVDTNVKTKASRSIITSIKNFKRIKMPKTAADGWTDAGYINDSGEEFVLSGPGYCPYRAPHTYTDERLPGPPLLGRSTDQIDIDDNARFPPMIGDRNFPFPGPATFSLEDVEQERARVAEQTQGTNPKRKLSRLDPGPFPATKQRLMLKGPSENSSAGAERPRVQRLKLKLRPPTQADLDSGAIPVPGSQVTSTQSVKSGRRRGRPPGSKNHHVRRGGRVGRGGVTGRGISLAGGSPNTAHTGASTPRSEDTSRSNPGGSVRGVSTRASTPRRRNTPRGAGTPRTVSTRSGTPRGMNTPGLHGDSTSLGGFSRASTPMFQMALENMT